MTSKENKKYSHLTKEERNIIEDMLKQGYSLVIISNTISRDKTTISKEIKNHRELKYPDKFNNQNNFCIHRKICKKSNCNNKLICFDMICPLLKKSPYVCNGCERKNVCRNVKYYYNARHAQNDYEDNLSKCRQGVRLSKKEEQEIEDVIYDLIKNKHQSINDIYINHPDLLTFSKVTLYNYIDKGLFHLKNSDLRRKLYYKPRIKESTVIRKETKIRKNRTYKDFLEFISKHPFFNIVEMDTVEGIKGGKVLLTLLFRKHKLMISFIMNNKTIDEVIKVFDYLKKNLGTELFKKLFRVILTDNGSEFFDPDSIENINGKKVIKLFYCDPCKSYQKANIEKNHEYIRYILPKGNTFDYLTQDDINLIMSHINNSPRNSLKQLKTPYLSFKKEYGEDILNLLNIKYINPDDVTLSKKLLKDSKERRLFLDKLIRNLEYYYLTSKKIKIDNNIKKIIINTFVDNWYLYTKESIFYTSKQIIDSYYSKQ